ncbi:hypothetical protein Q428_08320 [Fervidicella metallireducens AeB]|uniref:Phosphoglycerate mutase n=1 Tax=Fervidicella metallireducens AeB TaxID=1403537 RepID=A0A017RVF2_9CLOT|nr:histidine phosphatase family protein [Fervidicella metallireducens]EYE88394.1 hypothetical protein Q428_08320 [Fervidicella metallireducens AeB]
MSKIYLVRHGETEWNKAQRTQGCSNNIPLSEEGIKQAKALGERLKNKEIDLFFSSELGRAYETANIIASYHNKKVEIVEAFKEINFGVWEGLQYKEIMEKYKEVYSIWHYEPHLAKIPGGEDILSLKERSMTKLIEILNNNKEKNILIVSHGITIKVMICAMLGIDLANMHKIRQDNTSLNLFEYNDRGFSVIHLNDTCHIGL